MASGARWLNHYESRHGRRLRILHIGNIANNAYHNAKLLNAAGAECDVLCPEYYHIMGCPEWEDADFETAVTNHHYPDWSALDLGEFERQRWFVQGPLDLCIGYLLARHRGDAGRCARLWRQLGLMNRTLAVGGRAKIAVAFIRTRLFALRTLRFLLLPQRVADKIGEVAQQFSRRPRAERLIALTVLRLARPVLLLVSRLVSWYGRHFLFRTKTAGQGGPGGVVGQLLEEFHAAFPDRTDQLQFSDLLPHLFQQERLGELLRYYDVVQAYATEVTIPMMAGRRFVAFEHGTLRDIPFNATPQGRLTALGFHKADNIFVTNVDCMDNARYLASGGITFINHPYDEDHARGVGGFEQRRTELRNALNADFLIFAPTRHDWVPGTGFADKANDVFLRAFARLRAGGLHIGVILCEWGSNVRESTELIAELECTAFVRWLPPMGMVNFDRHALACDIVADQFLLGAFGGVTFKAMAAGAPVCSYLDTAEVRKSFDTEPPLVNCRTEDDIVERLTSLYYDREQLAAFGRGARKWIEDFHSAERVVDAQCEVYARFVPDGAHVPGQQSGA